jgi:hypothetical protein
MNIPIIHTDSYITHRNPETTRYTWNPSKFRPRDSSQTTSPENIGRGQDTSLLGIYSKVENDR